MPRPTSPPTPASSLDLTGKVPTTLCPDEPVFTLPPPAVESWEALETTPRARLAPRLKSVQLISPPTSTIESCRKRPSHTTSSVDDRSGSLPPPPGRARRIIQVKPQWNDETKTVESWNAGRAKDGNNGTNGCPSKRKQVKGSSSAGRKIARKTAHSLIERRRRGKMNEEFGVLKEMIPACRGQELHKLSILQAGIEYLQYLEECVTNLQEPPSSTPAERGAPRTTSSVKAESRSMARQAQYSQDVSLSSELHTSPASPDLRMTKQQAASPSSSPSEAFGRHPHEMISTMRSPLRLPTPEFFQPLCPGMRPSRQEGHMSVRSEEDREATEALLLLNTDRRECAVGNGLKRSSDVVK